MAKLLTSPVYPLLNSSGDCTRISPKVSAVDCRTIIAVTGDPHILNHICQLAIKTTADYVRTNSLTFIDSPRLLDYLRERSVSATAKPEADARNDAGRDSGGGESTAAATKRQQPESRKGTPSGSGGEEGKGGARGNGRRKEGKS